MYLTRATTAANRCGPAKQGTRSFRRITLTRPLTAPISSFFFLMAEVSRAKNNSNMFDFS